MNLSFMLTVLLTFCLPALVMTGLSTTSLAAGVLGCAVIWSLRAAAVTPVGTHLTVGWKFVSWVLIGMVGVTLHGLISWAVTASRPDVTRMVASMAIGVVVLFGAYFASRQVTAMSPSNVDRALRLTFNALTAIAILAATGIWTPLSGNNPVGFFMEPSHFALAFAPVALWRVASAPKGWRRMGLICSIFALALILQNLTLMVAGILISFVVLNVARLVAALGVLAAGTLIINFNYFYSRLNLSSGTTNLSSLVYLSGWARAWMNLQDTHGIGVGFQQFGILGRLDVFGQLIVDITGATSNLLDGGSTASKIIAEFGVIGIAVLLVYFRLLYRSYWYVRNASAERRPNHENARELFLHACVMMYTTELFIRGVGYFSPSGFLLIVALISFSRQKRRTPVTARPNGPAHPFLAV